MPTLEEFVRDTLTANNIPGDVAEIIKKITDVARERAVNGCATISDEEVAEMVINNAELSAKLAEEREKKAHERAIQKAEEQRIKDEAKAQKKAEKTLEKERKVVGGEQISLFG